ARIRRDASQSNRSHGTRTTVVAVDISGSVNTGAHSGPLGPTSDRCVRAGSRSAIADECSTRNGITARTTAVRASRSDVPNPTPMYRTPRIVGTGTVSTPDPALASPRTRFGSVSRQVTSYPAPSAELVESVRHRALRSPAKRSDAATTWAPVGLVTRARI